MRGKLRILTGFRYTTRALETFSAIDAARAKRFFGSGTACQQLTRPVNDRDHDVAMAPCPRGARTAPAHGHRQRL